MRGSGGRYLKPPRRAGQAKRRVRAWPVRRLTESGSATRGRRVRHLGPTCRCPRDAGPARQRKKKGERRGVGLLGWFGSGWASPRAVRGRKEGGGKEQAAGESWAFGPKPEGRVLLFYFLFLFFSFKTNLFQNIFKTKFKFLFNLYPNHSSQ